MMSRKILFITLSALTLLSTLMAFSAFESKPLLRTSRTGSTETIEALKDGKIAYRIVYTYDGNRKIRGEYWAAIDKEKKAGKKPESNILAGTAIAKKYESMLSGSNTADTSGVLLDVEKDGFMLRNVRIAEYNDKGLPSRVMARGYTSYPVLGVFNLKTDYLYTYNQEGMLIEIKETNLNIDSLLLNMGIGNITKITRDAQRRPLTVRREIGSAPPVFENTVYTYAGLADDMQRTVYQKCGIDTKTMSALPTETITIDYGKGIPWSGRKKYEFSMGRTITGILIYDNVNRKKKLDGSKFMKLSVFEKGMFMKELYGVYKNEQQGPKWRMGELPDVPEPFMMYREYAWWN